jgi:alpha-L-fucosidase 2
MAAIDEILKGSSFNQGYYELKYRHIEDHYSLFGRNTLELESNSIDFDLTTDELLKYYREGGRSNYLEVLLYQYGRYDKTWFARMGSI